MKLLLPGAMDTHCHTEFSFDSKEKVEEYLEQTEGLVVTTEHLDFDNPVTARDDLPDYEKYCARWAELNKKYDNRLKKGIEVGYTLESEERIREFLQDKDYDIILLSIHQNGVFDFMDKSVKEMPAEQVANEYLDRMIVATERFPEADILAHIDYGFRSIEYNRDLLKDLRGKFERVLRNIISTETALELNSRSMYQFKNLEIYKFAIDIYKELGGKLYTIGSDAHFKNYYRYCFDQTIKFLQENS